MILPAIRDRVPRILQSLHSVPATLWPAWIPTIRAKRRSPLAALAFHHLDQQLDGRAPDRRRCSHGPIEPLSLASPSKGFLRILTVSSVSCKLPATPISHGRPGDREDLVIVPIGKGTIKLALVRQWQPHARVPFL